MGGLAVLAKRGRPPRHRLRRQRLSADEHPARGPGHRADPGLRPGPGGAQPDLFVIGNAISRGNPLMEDILDDGLPYSQRPAVAGRACAATTRCWPSPARTARPPPPRCSPGSWSDAGLAPGFLVGGVPLQLRRLRAPAGATGESHSFVIEADEYDTAFFDKRSKFVHYRAAHRGAEQPRVRPRRHLPRPGRHRDASSTTSCAPCPACGRLVVNAREESLQRVLERGCWSEVQRFGARKEGPGALREHPRRAAASTCCAARRSGARRLGPAAASTTA